MPHVSKASLFVDYDDKNDSCEGASGSWVKTGNPRSFRPRTRKLS